MNRQSLLSSEQIREFVIAGHGNFDKVKEMLAETPSLLNVAYEWGKNDTETAIQGAAHVGSVHIINYLLAQGAPIELCTAAALGRVKEVERMLTENPESIHASGAHGIPLLTHATFSDDVDLVKMLYERGAVEGTSAALSVAVGRKNLELARWILENGEPDLSWKNFQEKTPLNIAADQGNQEMVDLLCQYGAKA